MAEMVGSALAQETISRSVSFIFGKHEEKASRAHYIEKLEMARSGLESTLELTNKMPIIHPSLLGRRNKLKRAYEECGELLDRSKRRVLEDEESSEQGVTAGSSLAWRAFHAVKSFVSSSVSQKNDGLSGFNVRRFEWYAEEASKFVRDVESGCSLAHYRFMSPLVRPLVEGKTLFWHVRNCFLIIKPTCSEEGLEAQLVFCRIDPKMPTKGSFALFLVLRLSESTDMVGIAIERLRSLGPLFKSLAQLAVGELTQLPAQDVRVVVGNLDISHSCVSGLFKSLAQLAVGELTQLHAQDVRAAVRNLDISRTCVSGCSKAIELDKCRGVNSVIISSEMSYKLPEQFTHMCFHGSISGFDKHNQQISSLDGAFMFPDAPSCGNSFTVEFVRDATPSPHEMEEMVRTRAIDFFNRQPELMEYGMMWFSQQFLATIIVQRRIIESRGRSKTRRVTKRRRQEILVHFHVEHR